MNRLARPAPQAATWNRTTVRAIIENPVYAGELHGVKKTHEAIVSRRLWNQANTALRSRRRRE
jgi:hypothetical protein